MANTLGDMVVRIVGDTTGFNKSLTDTQKNMAAFGINAAAIGAAVVKVAQVTAKAVKDFTDYGSAIFDASQKTGLSTDAIQEWKFIAEQSGTTLETVTSSVALMTKGLETNKEEYKRLGIEVKNADGSFKSTTDIFNETISVLSNMTNETERDQLAFKLLGRGAQAMIPILNTGSDSLDNMRKEAKALGLVIKNEAIINADTLGDSVDALKAATQTYSATLVNNLSPALLSIVDKMKSYVVEAINATTATEDLNAAMAGKATTEQYKNALELIDAQISVLQESGIYVKGNAQLIEELSKKRKILLDNQINEDRTRIETEKKLYKDKTQAEKEAEKAKNAEILKLKKEKDDAYEELDYQNKIALAELNLWFDSIINEANNEANNKLLDNSEKVQKEITDIEKEEYGDRIQALWDYYAKVEEKEKEQKERLVKYAQEAYSAIADIINQFNKNKITSLQNANDEELASLKNKLDLDQITQQQYDSQKANAEANLKLRQYELEVKAFKSSQALAVGEVAINTAVAVSKIWAQGGVLGPLLAVGAGAMGLFQTALILSKQPPARPFADGGIVRAQPGGVQALVAEAGQSEAIIPLDRLDQMLAKAGGSSESEGMMSLIVNLDSRPLLDKIFSATKNRTVLISAGAVV